MSLNSYTFTRPAARRRMEKILQLLANAPDGLTRLELAAATAISDRCMKAYLAALRGSRDDMSRKVRVRSWRRQLGVGGYHEAVFGLGAEPDARRPRPESQATRVARYRAKLKRERPEDYHQLLERQRRQRALEKASKPRRDPAAIALFGQAGSCT